MTTKLADISCHVYNKITVYIYIVDDVCKNEIYIQADFGKIDKKTKNQHV